MGRYVDTNSFSNAFNLQRQLGSQLRAADQAEEMNAMSIGRQRRIDALGPDANAEQYVRAGDTQTGQALAGIEADKHARLQGAFPKVGTIAAQISGLADPAQKRAAFKNAILQNGGLFDAMGMPHAEAIAKLDATDDATLDATLAKLASFAPQAAPQDVAPGHSLVRPDGQGGFSAAYTAPSAAGEGSDGFSLSPGQVRFDKAGRRIAGVEAAPDNAGRNDAFNHAATLRDDFRNDSKDFVGVASAYQRITDSSADPSPAGDISLLFNYLKVLDPGSTVREGEFATVAQSGGLPSKVQSLWNKMVNGMLPNEVRKDVVGRATQLYRGQEGRFKKNVLERYQGLAKRYGIDPAEFGDPRAQVPTNALPPTNAQGWSLHVDGDGNRAYVSPDGKQFDEVQ